MAGRAAKSKAGWRNFLHDISRMALERFQRRLSQMKRSISSFLRNSGRETGSHPRLRGGMLSLELL